jgi:hypothetical protein
MRNARALLFYSVIGIFLATAALTLLGIAGVVAIPERFLQVLFTALVVELVAAVISLFKATDWFGDERGSKAAEGGWWQLARAEADENMVAFFHIAWSKEEQQLRVDGWAFTADGEEHSRFWSEAAAYNASTRELHYLWQGDRERTDDDFSGLGYIRFATDTTADGWYHTGNVEQLRLLPRRKVDYVRAPEADRKTMLSENDPAARRRLAAAAFARLKSSSGAPEPSRGGAASAGRP